MTIVEVRKRVLNTDFRLLASLLLNKCAMTMTLVHLWRRSSMFANPVLCVNALANAYRLVNMSPAPQAGEMSSFVKRGELCYCDSQVLGSGMH